MSATDITWKIESTVTTIREPLEVTSTLIQIRVVNDGDTNLTNLGLYVVPASWTGDVDNPPQYNRYTDYQDLLTWGTRTVEALDVSGGIKVTVPQNSGPDLTFYFTREQGTSRDNKIPFKNLPVSSYEVFDLEIEVPTVYTARRFFVDLVLE